VVTLPELPYEKTVYERPLYPGTLTYNRTVPTIELVMRVPKLQSETVADSETCVAYFAAMSTYYDLDVRSGKPQGKQMRTRSLKQNTIRRRHRESGFSLIEMLSVVAIIIVLASITFISMVPVLKQQRVTNGYNTTLSALRLARDSAVSQRTSYSVTFSTTAVPNTITVTPTLSTFQGAQNTVVYKLPFDVVFDVESAYASTPPPDGYGAGLVAVDLGYTANGGTGNSKTLYFCPDGSSQDAEGGGGNCAGSWDGGVIYIARAGELMSSRAVTVWGGTGRIRGWRIYSNGAGGYQWLRQ
jgi:prepilin-type N-terminal cleavage/methylation domain-containing protein